MEGFPLFAGRRKNVFLRIAAVALSLVCVLVVLNLDVFAQNTYVIKDGDQVIVHTTYASDPAIALDEAGIKLTNEAYVTTMSAEGVYDITVLRDDKVTVVDRGVVKEIQIKDTTVGALLNRAGIPTGENYHVSVPLNKKPTDGMKIVVNHIVDTQVSYTVDIPYETTTVFDPTLPEGQEKVLVEGAVGQTLYNTVIRYRNAREIARSYISQEVLQEPQMRVIAVGTGEQVGQKLEEPLIGEDVIVLPSGEVLAYYMKDTYEATAYTMYDEGCNDVTACMTKVKWGVVAVDPDLIPYGTRMYIVTEKGNFIYGIGTAEDCGGAIQGKRLDLYMPTLAQAFRFGRQNVTVYFLGDANWTY